MAFKEAKDKPARIKRLGTIWEAKEHTGLYIRIDADCDLVLYDKKTNTYHKVVRIATTEPVKDAPQNAVLDCYVNLDNEKHVTYLGSDQE